MDELQFRVCGKAIARAHFTKQTNFRTRISRYLYFELGNIIRPVDFAVEIVPVANETERMFWDYVNRDPIDYYFFIMDWSQNREQTKIFLAIEGNEIMGSLLVFADSIVQFRGSHKAVQKLIECVKFDKVELQAPPDCEDVVSQRFKPRIKECMVLMRLNRGEENHIDRVQTPSRLDVEDADEIASLLRRCFPERYGKIASEEIRQRWQNNTYWLGIRNEKKLVSVGNTRFYFNFATNIHVVATDEHYRCRGYATSIVSALVQEIFRRSPIALIHVMAGNAPAVRAYSKVGFKPHKTYLSIRS